MARKLPKQGPIAQRRSRLGLYRFRRDENGVTAVEFGFIAMPFLALLLAIFEVALSFFGVLMVENAVEESARLIRTGQAQENGFSEAQFKQDICDRIYTFNDCMEELRLEVKTYADFADINMESPVDTDGNFTDNYDFDMGVGEEIVVVRAFYKWELMNKIMGLGISNMADGSLLINASAAFRNEPF